MYRMINTECAADGYFASPDQPVNASGDEASASARSGIVLGLEEERRRTHAARITTSAQALDLSPMITNTAALSRPTVGGRSPNLAPSAGLDKAAQDSALLAQPREVEAATTYNGEMNVSGTVTQKEGNAEIVTTFSGQFGIELVATLDSGGSGSGYEVIIGSIYFSYTYAGKKHDGNEAYFEKAPDISFNDDSFSVSDKAGTIIFGVTTTDTITGTVSQDHQQISEKVDIPFTGTTGGVALSGAISGSGALTAPFVSISGTGNSNTYDTVPVKPFANVVITDLDAGQTDTVTITLSNPANGTLSNLGGGSFDSTTGTYTISGSSSSVTAALQGLEFNPTLYQAQAGQIVTTSFAISVTDGAGYSASNTATNVYTTETQPVPTLSGTGNSVNYVPGAAAVVLDPNLTVADPGSKTLAGATVAIGFGFVSGDTLNFVNQNNISGKYNAGTGLLTLSGVDTLANYQAALESITFSNSKSNPSASGTELSRTIVWDVNDGSESNGPYFTNVVIGIPTTVQAGQTQTVSSGQTAYGTIVQSGGEQIVESGGTAFGTSVSSGGEVVYSGGVINGLVLASGSIRGIGSGISLSGLDAAFGLELAVSSGGSTTGTTLVAGGTEFVSSGGTESGATVLSGGVLEVLGGSVEGAAISSGVELQFLGSTNSAMVSGGRQFVFGGVASGTEILAGGFTLAGNFENGSTGGTLADTLVHSGGILVLSEHGEADDTTVAVGATLLELAGLASGVSLAGTQFVGGGLPGLPPANPPVPAVTSDVAIQDGGKLTVNAHGSAFGTMVDSGGDIELVAGGVVSGTTVSGGGDFLMLSGSDAALTVDAGGTVDQFAGSTSDASLSGGDLVVVGGAASGVSVGSGGLALAGNFFNAPTGGTLLDVTVSSGGLVVLGQHGLLSGATMTDATLFQLAGVASGVVMSGGTQYVGGSLPGVPPPVSATPAVAFATTLSSGAREIVNANGSAIDTDVLSGGEIVFNGGLTSGLMLANGAMIDVPSLVYSSAITLSFVENSSRTGGTLTVKWGTGSHSVDLLGQYVAGGFQASSDGDGGTLVSYSSAAGATESLAATHH